MKFKTKFSCGETVYPIVNKREQYFVECSFCSGIGWITGNDKNTQSCPVCHGNRGIWKYGENKWVVGVVLTVGQVRVQYTCNTFDVIDENLFDNYSPHNEEYKEDYMCLETGIGSGTIHQSDRLFSTEDEAIQECKIRNDIVEGK